MHYIIQLFYFKIPIAKGWILYENKSKLAASLRLLDTGESWSTILGINLRVAYGFLQTYVVNWGRKYSQIQQRISMKSLNRFR